MANYQNTAKKKDKKGKGVSVMTNAELKELLQKQGFINEKRS